MKLYDAHTHIKKEHLSNILKQDIISIINSCNIEEYKENILIVDSKIHHSFGIHPKDSDNVDYKELDYFLAKTALIGEIGLDNVWCDIDLDIQKAVFIYQLKHAFNYKKPVILHTKGMENEIVEIIKDYPNKYLVHWYSCLNHLEKYIAMDCYFTIGPSIIWDESVINVARKVNVERLLLETDGIDAIKWAYSENDLAYDNINEYDSLKQTLEMIANIKGITIEKLNEIISTNFEKFIEKDVNFKN